MRKIMTLLGTGMCLLVLNASAAEFTANYTANGENAQALFVTGAGTLDITLQNLLVDPRSIADCISGLSFTLSSGQTAGTLGSSAGRERTIASNGTFTDGAVVSTGWALSGTSLFLNDLAGGAAGPTHVLIGAAGNDNDYNRANASILGNGAHNPYLVGDVTFHLLINGLTASDTVTAAVFQFGTTPTTPPPSVPDGGTTVLLLGATLSGIGLIRRKLS